MKQYVSEVVTQDEIKSWKQGDIITITAGTGAGKSRFIKVSLYAHAKAQGKKILFLIHRRNCVDQFQMEIEQDNKTDVIEIKTYQHIDATISKHGNYDFSKYAYIVSDEFHYFIQDAAFNKTTDISLKAILEQSNKIRIFMSATGDYVKRYIKDHKKLDTTDYDVPVNFKFLMSLQFYSSDSALDEFITEAIKENKKSIFFIDSAEKAYELHTRFKEYTLFNCSKYNTKYYKHVNEEKINEMLRDERFEELILITTTTMDAGVNIRDEEVRNIVCDVKDIRTLIQCIGRKRQQNDDDKVHLTVKNVSNKSIGGLMTKLRQKKKMAEYLNKNGIDKYIEEFPRDYDAHNIVYVDKLDDVNVTLKINYLMYIKCLIDLVEYEVMIKGYDSFGYAKFLAEKLGFYDQYYKYYEFEFYDSKVKKQTLEEYLDSLIGNKLDKEKQSELIDNIDVRVNGRQQKSFSKLNEGLKMLELPFIIVPKQSSKLENGKKKNIRYWMVEKLEN